jgi:hypothetical protein
VAATVDLRIVVELSGSVGLVGVGQHIDQSAIVPVMVITTRVEVGDTLEEEVGTQITTEAILVGVVVLLTHHSERPKTLL